jgi:predicted nucleotidyltransferase
MATDSILSDIISKVQRVTPYAKVVLFGSRVYGVPTAESDWDILILTRQPVNPSVKKNIHTALFPLSVQIGAFINALTVQEDDWLTNPSFYSLRQTINRGAAAYEH